MRIGNETDPQILPVYALIDYAWDTLKANTTMKESDYNGRVPIIPSSQQPEFTDIDKPFIVYRWTETQTDPSSSLRHGQVSFMVYSAHDRDITRISNILVSAFNKWDESAENINVWKANTVFNTIRFATTWATMFDGPAPESQEGGRRSSLINVRFKYIAEYVIVSPPPRA